MTLGQSHRRWRVVVIVASTSQSNRWCEHRRRPALTLLLCCCRGGGRRRDDGDFHDNAVIEDVKVDMTRMWWSLRMRRRGCRRHDVIAEFYSVIAASS